MAKSATAAVTAPLKKVHSTGKKIVGWIVYVLAIADATLLVGTFLGDGYRFVMNLWPPAWRVTILLIAGVILLITAVVDVLNDLWPNLGAVFCTLALPTVVSPLSGGFAEWIDGGSEWVFGLIDQWLREAIPDGAGGFGQAVAIALLVAVVMLGQRFNKKGAK